MGKLTVIERTVLVSAVIIVTVWATSLPSKGPDNHTFRETPFISGTEMEADDIAFCDGDMVKGPLTIKEGASRIIGYRYKCTERKPSPV